MEEDGFLNLGDGEPLMIEAEKCHGEGVVVVHDMEKLSEERLKDGKRYQWVRLG
jgi:hypothetical protein